MHLLLAIAYFDDAILYPPIEYLAMVDSPIIIDSSKLHGVSAAIWQHIRRQHGRAYIAASPQIDNVVVLIAATTLLICIIDVEFIVP